MHRYKTCNFANLFLALLIFSLTGFVNANETKAQSFTPKKYFLNGFISQAIIHSTDNNFLGESDDRLSSDFSEVGIIFNAKPIDQFQVSAQILGRRDGISNDGKLRIDFAFLSYTLINNFDWQLGFRGGRLKAPFGFYGDTRDVAFTRPTIFLPQSIYLDRVRNTGFSQDGLQIFASRNAENYHVSWQFSVVDPTPDKDEISDFYPVAVEGKIKANPSYITRLAFEPASGSHKFALTYNRTNSDYKPAPNDFLQISETIIRYILASYEFNNEKFSLIMEIMDIDIALGDSSTHFPGRKYNEDGLSHYIQSTYRFRSNWDAVLRYDTYYTNRNDRSGEALEQQTFGFFLARASFAKTWTASVGWHFHKNWLARLEFHDVDGTGWISKANNPDRFLTHQRWQILAAQLSYRF
ncbi:MAG: hypothetical protein COB51_14555 [Moraxellaceae bacterium]|nr:MAG: hypothetical protein COB51_14555 [Moraxellaceae bacterium]